MLRTLINQRLGRYDIKELLGHGGMAAVYRATDIVLQRDVALKVLYSQYSDDQSLVERFTREAITAAALEHPNIVPVYDVGEHDGMAYIAMKLLNGETLQAHLQHAGTLSPEDLCLILRPVADALDYAHSRNVIHRDIKPGNIFLGHTASGAMQVMLTDFGIAKQLDTPGLTTTGALIGTPDYMAPEQIAGRPVDARSDVYALGILAYRALTGRRAFEGSTQDVLMGHLYRQPPAPSSITPTLPPYIDAVVLRAVATNPVARFPSAGAFIKALGSTNNATAVGAAPALASIVYPEPGPTGRINNVPTLVNPVTQGRSLHQPSPSQSSPVGPSVTYTTIQSTRRQTALAEPPSNSIVAWFVTIILALLVGGLAVAVGFMLSNRQNSALSGSVGTIHTPTPSPTPHVTAVPTLMRIATPSPTDAASMAIIPTSVPSATASPPVPSPIKPTSTPPPVVPATSTSTPTATATDVALPTAKVNPTATATVTLTPTATTTPTPTVDCTEGILQGGFERIYREEIAVRTRLGCPKVGERTGQGSEQFFTKGTMLYWGLNPTGLRDSIIIFYGLDKGSYVIVSNDEAASYPEPAQSEDPNSPVRGFGRVYFGKPGVAEAIGSWTSPEIELKDTTLGVIQFFESGIMIYTPIYQQPGSSKQAIFVLYADGTFERYNDQPAS
ncbi:MAG: serine/threonine protein kinase [Oscillochloris sp.]|nr:serine/threonine protein kinase [Oscillochloris sp.]